MEHTTKNYRVSGHESFACRYAWLPKVAHHLQRDHTILTDDSRAMVELGVGKNMVQSIRFWAQSADIVKAPGKTGKHVLTGFAIELLGERGLDPYLEDIRTLWLIHWKLATNVEAPLMAWDYLLNNWQEPEMTQSSVVGALEKEATKRGSKLSSTTITKHFEVFLHTYVPTRGRKGTIQEDNLDCPLVELELITRQGERGADGPNGRRESIYAFNRDWKPEISNELFLYSLNDFWQVRHKDEATLSLREVAHGHGSPGQIFKLPEEDVRSRLEELNNGPNTPFSYAESLHLQQVRRHRAGSGSELLRHIYRP
ncbi:MAG: DUF4007 family protein [Acidobacteriota bacterium]